MDVSNITSSSTLISFENTLAQVIRDLQSGPENTLTHETKLQELLNFGLSPTNQELQDLASLGYSISKNPNTIERFSQFVFAQAPELENAIRRAIPSTGLLLDKFRALRPGPAPTPGGSAKGYDEIFAIFEMQTTEKEENSKFIARFLSQINLENKRLVDVGCGNGVQLKALSDVCPFSSITGIDNQKGSIEKASTLFQNPLHSFKEVDVFSSTLNIPPADIILISHFYCSREKIPLVLDKLKSSEEKNSLYIFINSTPESDTAQLSKNLSFVRPPPTSNMSSAFVQELKNREYECETHIVEASLKFPAITDEIRHTILNLSRGDYENANLVDPNFKVIKALMEFLAGFPLEAFTYDERSCYLDYLQKKFKENGDNFLKISSQIILAHPPTVTAHFSRLFKTFHGDILDDTLWDQMLPNYQKTYEEALNEVDRGLYNQAEDRLSKALKQLDLFQRSSVADHTLIAQELAKGYLLLSTILIYKHLYHHSMGIAWFAKRIDPTCEDQANQQIEIIERKCLLKFTEKPLVKGLGQAKKDKEALEKIRTDIKRKLEAISPQDKISELRSLYQEITDRMKKFLAELLEDTEKHLKTMELSPPCSYAVIGLGSLARQEVTPYSDLEFAILTKEEVPDKSYFRALTLLFHLRIINLGETIVPSLGIDSLNWLFDNKTPRGLAFDGNMSTASKTPYGKKRGEKGDYELIGTSSYFLTFQDNWTEDSDSDRVWAAKRYHLPLILSNTTLITGDESLFEDYNNSVHDRRSSFLSLSVLQEDLIIFNPNLEEDVSGKTYNVKKDLYRLPTMMIDGLAEQFKLKTQSSWKRIEDLQEKGIFSYLAAQDLLKLLMLTQELRLRTYFSHNCQKDVLPQETYRDLYSFYYTALPFMESMRQFCHSAHEREVNKTALHKSRFFDDSLFCQGLVHRRLLNYREAEEKLEKEPQDTLAYHQTMADIKAALYKLDQAQTHYQKMVETIPSEQVELIAATWIKKAEIHQKQASYKEAEQALNHAKQALGNTSSPVFEKLGRVRALFRMGLSDFKQAEKILEENFQLIQKRLSKKKKDPRYRVKIDLSLGETLMLSAQVHKELFQFDKAEKELQEAFDIFMGYYQNSNHPKLAKMHLLFGGLIDASGRPQQALARKEQALAIYTSLFKDDHPDVAECYNKLGLSLEELGNHEEALHKHREALKIFANLFGENHPDVARCYGNISISLRKLGQNKEALESQQKALGIWGVLFPQGNHPDIAKSYNNEGNSLNEEGKHQEALASHKKALKIYRSLSLENHPDVATCYDHIGLSLGKIADHEQALKQKQNALTIRLKTLESSHPDVGLSYNNVGLSLAKLDRHPEALKHYEEALKIFLLRFGDFHSHTAGCYTNMGNSLLKLNEFEKALEKLEKALNIYIFVEDSSQIATCYANMGTCSIKLKNYQQALEKLEQALAIRSTAPGSDTQKIEEKIAYCKRKLSAQ